MTIYNSLAIGNMAKVNEIRNYIQGEHKVLGRKDFNFGGNTLETAKIVLQSIKSIVDFHSSYICGNPISITGDKSIVKLTQGIYKKGFYNKVDYEIAKNIYTYGNAFEFVYRDEKGIIKSKVINNTDSYPIYENGIYTAFIERWVDTSTSIEYETKYTSTDVIEYENGLPVKSYHNPSGLPIHYTSGNFDRTGFFGNGIVKDLIPIMNEIESLLSKMSDSVTTLSLNPLGVSIGDRIDTSVDKDVTGAIINIEAGGDYKWSTANLDTQAIKLILDNLLNQFFTIAQVLSALYGQSNIANVSEVSLKLLFNNADAMAKRVAFSILEGMCQRLEYVGLLLDADLSSVNIAFNYNRPIDNSSLLNDLKVQWDMKAISQESIIRNSPYTTDVEKELQLLKNAKENEQLIDDVVTDTNENKYNEDD